MSESNSNAGSSDLGSAKIAGFDIPAVENWIQENIPSLTPPLTWTRLEGGHSNLTYKIVDQNGTPAVIRRPPVGELLPKAHDMSREWSIISALSKTQVPVPAALGFCESPDVTGAWFYVMGWVDGRPLHSTVDTREWVPEASRKKMAYSFIDSLAELHSLEPDDIGLGQLGKKEGYLARQIKTWHRSWMACIEAAQLDDPRAHSIKDFMLENLPEQGKARLVHGDFFVSNCLIGKTSTIAAVVDWELSTLGDPLADLGYAMHRWVNNDDEHSRKNNATAVECMPDQKELAARYAEVTGRDISKLNFYIGFNHWKSACIIHGVYARYLAGMKSSEGVDLEELKKLILDKLRIAESYLKIT